MSRIKVAVLVVAGCLLGGVVVSSLSPPDAMAGGVVSGRKANTILTYFAELAGGESLIIPEVPGDRGFIITDVVSSGPMFTFQQNDVTIAKISQAHFESGVRVSAGSKLTVKPNSGQPHFITICGYTF